MRPQAHPYLFIIFFATFFEYNLHRLITIISNPKALESDKHKWVKNNRNFFYGIVIISLTGFVISIALAKKEVIFTLAPIAMITLFYSLPVFKRNVFLFRLREIPLLKIFLISFVWSAITILLPIIQSALPFDRMHVILMLAERFLFVFAITIPFDIRDVVIDQQSGLKTIPILLGEKWSLRISNMALLLFMLLCLYHYSASNEGFLLMALILSALTTLFFINNQELKKMAYYHYGLLDGTMLLQGLLVLLFYFTKGI
ncbi:MAG TPA: UbiA family prenyltransferase [Prolixibacteraceae bacterium]|nr:UbiA family prenyltransferase [Prolixibacteraceae bacterium]